MEEKLKKIIDKHQKYLAYVLLLGFLLVLLNAFVLRSINFTTADLGRHIENGKIAWEDHKIPSTNLYSYTYPDFSFINHHWASGVLFYLVFKNFGFSALSFAYLFLTFLTFFIVFSLSQKNSSFGLAFVLSLFIIPLIGERTEVRPEVWSYLFSVIFLYLLWEYRNNKIGFRWLLILPAIELLWVNFHIYFIFGIGIIGAFLVENLILYIIGKKEENLEKLKRLLAILVFSSFTAIINPFGFQAVTYPFKIFGNYGYKVVENQTIGFLKGYGMANPNFNLIEFLIAVLLASFIWIFFKKRQSFSIAFFLIAVAISALGYMALRNFALFGFMALPILAYNFSEIFSLKSQKNSGLLNFSYVIFGLFAIFYIFFNFGDKIEASNGQKMDLAENVNSSAEFFKKNNLKGPIFNNYDIGSYLIFHLYPQEKVFVDNRPEAYPASFFQDVYIPAQEKNSEWKKLDEKYNFNAIFFTANDITPWAQTFLASREKDSEWTKVYSDEYAIIFLKNNEANKEVIGKYQIGK